MLIVSVYLHLKKFKLNYQKSDEFECSLNQDREIISQIVSYIDN